MKKIIVEEFGQELTLFFDPREVEKAETDGEVLECLKHHNGNMPYSPMRCAMLAKRTEGMALIRKIRGMCESRTDTGKSPKGRRTPKVD